MSFGTIVSSTDDLANSWVFCEQAFISHACVSFYASGGRKA